MEPVILPIDHIGLAIWGRCRVRHPQRLTEPLVLRQHRVQALQIGLAEVTLLNEEAQLPFELRVFIHQAIHLSPQADGLTLQTRLPAAQLRLLLLRGRQLLLGLFVALFQRLLSLLRLTAQFGVTFTYRERFSSRGNLAYYSLQEVIRFLKTQEKVLIKSLYDELKERGIDTSDLKDSVVAYINQGVINSGDIRGDVFTSIKSFVFRRPARSIVKKSTRKATAHA
jgi:hypothetical protein